MRPGLSEIIIILIVIILILVVTRIIRVGRNSTDKSKTSDEIPFEQVAKRSSKVLQRLRVTGIIFLIIGIISLLAGISVFKWLYWSYLWAFIAIAIGFAMVFVSRKN